MVAADTSRSKAYLQAMIRNDLLPNHVLVLRSSAGRSLPGQLSGVGSLRPSVPVADADECWSEASFDLTEPLTATLEKAAIPTEVIACDDINRPDVVEIVQQRPEAVMVYSGYGGVLLRREILSTGKRFLHVHGGYLPDYKGSTTNYYSLIVENALGASSLFLSAEIDSGPVLQRRKFPPPADRLAIDHIYDSAARAKVLIDTLQSYVANGEWRFEVPENIGGETYYIVHPVLKHIAVLAGDHPDRCE